MVINRVYPGVTYTVKVRNDPFQLLSYNRLNTQRHHIAQEAVDLIQGHVASLDDLVAAQNWISWAFKKTGPIFFEHPSPANCPTDPNHPYFVAPGGRLKSTFVIKLARFAYKSSHGAVNVDSENGKEKKIPIGLFTLILTALERALKAVNPDGTPKDVKPFAGDKWGSEFTLYKSSLGSITRESWEEILALCEGIGDGDSELRANESMLDCDRGNLFDFESPKK